MWAIDQLTTDSPMWKDPSCNLPPLRNSFFPRLVELWSLSARQRDSELARSAADTVAMAYQRGMPGLEALEAHWVRLLTEPDQDRRVRRAAAHALVVLDARGRSELLAKVAVTDGLEVASFVEPALARWQVPTLKSNWLARLQDPTAPLLGRLLAVRCLAELQEPAAQPLLIPLIHDARTENSLRMAAARGLGTLADKGLVREARQLLDSAPSDTPLHHLLAVALLVRHVDGEAVELLRELTTHGEPSVAAAAFERLFAIDPKLTYELAARALNSADVNVRRAGTRSLLNQGDADAIRGLAPLLNDPNPSLRRWVAKSFVEFAAQPELADVVREVTNKALATDQWRALEQALLVAVHIEDKATAPRAVELMSHRRNEVAITACWALRRFRLPELLPVMLTHAEKQFARFTSGESNSHEDLSIEGQHTQLFQAFGEMRYLPANELLRKFVPKEPGYGRQPRCAACWSLGYLYEGQAPDDLTRQFRQRLADVESPQPELDEVRRMCAIGLGRMKSMAGLPEIKQFSDLEGVLSDTGIACWWAREQLTTDKRPPTPDLTQNILGWFLQPSR